MKKTAYYTYVNHVTVLGLDSGTAIIKYHFYFRRGSTAIQHGNSKRFASFPNFYELIFELWFSLNPKLGSFCHVESILYRVIDIG